MRISLRARIFTLVLVLLTLAIGVAGGPSLVSYRGRLVDAKGQPFTGEVKLSFSLYQSPTSGSSVWEETQAVVIDEGLFSVMLGAVNPLTNAPFKSNDVWLGISVNDDPEILPRSRLGSAGFSHRVSTIDGASAGSISGNLSLSGDMSLSGDLILNGSLRTFSGIVIESIGDSLSIVAGVSRITISPTGGVTIQSSDVKIVSSGDLSLTADSSLTISGRSIDVQSVLETTISSGFNVNIDAGVNIDIQAGAVATLQSAAITNVKGGLVQIN